MVRNDRNGRFACNFFHCEVMISSFAKDVGLQSGQKQRPIYDRHQEHNCRHRKVVQHNRSDNISHTPYCF